MRTATELLGKGLGSVAKGQQNVFRGHWEWKPLLTLLRTFSAKLTSHCNIRTIHPRSAEAFINARLTGVLFKNNMEALLKSYQEVEAVSLHTPPNTCWRDGCAEHMICNRLELPFRECCVCMRLGMYVVWEGGVRFSKLEQRALLRKHTIKHKHGRTDTPRTRHTHTHTHTHRHTHTHTRTQPSITCWRCYLSVSMCSTLQM